MYTSIIVAVALDHDDLATSLLDRASRLVDTGGTIRVVTVIEPIPVYAAPDFPPEMLDLHLASARKSLDAIVQGRPETLPRPPMTTDLRVGGAAAEIMAAAEEHGADLIMIASHKPGLSTYFIGSTAAKVVRHAQCSVLVVR